MKNIHKIFITLFIGFFLMSLGFEKSNTRKSSFQRTTSVLASDSLSKIDQTTGLIVSEHLDLVIAHCTGCHSSKLITQFHTDRQGWLEKIRWMQQKQKLWDLGEAEPKILDYLAKNYPPNEKVNRRAALKNIKWYRLENR
jgi:uncharacterized membrane protein